VRLELAGLIASGGTAARVGRVDGEGEVFVVQGGGHFNRACDEVDVKVVGLEGESRLCPADGKMKERGDSTAQLILMREINMGSLKVCLKCVLFNCGNTSG